MRTRGVQVLIGVIACVVLVAHSRIDWNALPTGQEAARVKLVVCLAPISIVSAIWWESRGRGEVRTGNESPRISLREDELLHISADRSLGRYSEGKDY